MSRVTFATAVGFHDPDLTAELVRDQFDAITDMTASSLLPTTWNGEKL